MDVKNLVVWALEASMHVEPRKPGLTPAELVELGSSFGVKGDEVTDQLRGRAMEGGRVLPFGIDPSFFGTYAGDLRNILAFDHVIAAFADVHRSAGGRPAMGSREAILTSGVAAGLPRGDLELAIATYRAFEGASEADDRWELLRVKAGAALPSAQRSGPAGVKLARRERYVEIVEAVRKILERRSPKVATAAAATASTARALAVPAPAARPISPEPQRPRPKEPDPEPEPTPSASPDLSPDLSPDGDDSMVAFGALLPALGHARLAPWWTQLVQDYRAAGRPETSLTRCFLAASIAESALLLACKKAGIPKPDPKATKPLRLNLTELARVASAIGFDGVLRGRIELLSKTRQKIQSGRLLEGTHPWNPLTPEDASEASDTLTATLRTILDWHQRAGHRVG